MILTVKIVKVWIWKKKGYNKVENPSDLSWKGISQAHFKAAKADMRYKVQWRILSSIQNKNKFVRIQEVMNQINQIVHVY